MTIPLYQIDAFTNRLFGGNPAAVCPLDSWITDELMQQIAAENNLSETAFFVLRPDGDYDLRWFTPAAEVDLCGHATLATAHVLFRHLGYAKDKIGFHTRSGLLTVVREGEGYLMDFPADRIEHVPAPAILAEALGAEPLEVWKGREDYLVVLPSEADVAALRPDFRKLMALGGRGVLATAPGDNHDFVSRCFFPTYGVDEDPVTGSAHTTLTPYWAARLGKTELRARQISARGGEVGCRLLGDRVELTGQAVTYMAGEILG
ncbi:MAG: PhzF family phenazine biosynthesis protein [Saprospiraceae bacterium]|nr:PhzF family phenazine biosynthesis protein [Saprospiraceae bacterium]